VQGHLIAWPYDWLDKVEAGGNWLFAKDNLTPLEIYIWEIAFRTYRTYHAMYLWKIRTSSSACLSDHQIWYRHFSMMTASVNVSISTIHHIHHRILNGAHILPTPTTTIPQSKPRSRHSTISLIPYIQSLSVLLLHTRAGRHILPQKSSVHCRKAERISWRDGVELGPETSCVQKLHLHLHLHHTYTLH